jgi:hypothetical protein
MAAIQKKIGAMALVSLLGRGHKQQIQVYCASWNMKWICLGGDLVFVSDTKLRDYHDTMYGENLEEMSLIVMDNASY